MLNLTSALRVASVLSLLATATYAADPRITDADQRFRIKFGIWPPHLQKSSNKTIDEFGRLDADRDGRISLKEWKKQNRCPCQFEDRDKDSDGHITRSEWHSETVEASGS